MPLNVRRFFASATLVVVGIGTGLAQTAAPENSNQAVVPNNPPAAKPVAAPTSAEIMRERISKAKAYIAVKNYNAAIYELENIRRETRDQTVHGVLNVLLMNSYLEQGDYKRAQDFLSELYNPTKAAKPIPSPFYFAVAGQVVKGARNQFERYRSLGLSVSDRNLPLEATVDIEKMRETLEVVIEQSKNAGADKNRTADAFALLEEATTSRGMLARDDYDAKRWKDAVSDARESLANSRSTILSAVNEPPTVETTPTGAAPTAPTSGSQVVLTETAASVKTNESLVGFKPVPTSAPAAEKTAAPKSNPVVKEIKQPEPKVDENTTAKTNVPVREEPKPNTETKTKDQPKTVEDSKPSRPRVTENTEAKNETQADNTASEPKDVSPVKIGSLLEYATKQAKPIYPPAARNIRQTGVVRVEVVVNEEGEVAEVQNTSGPSMLQSAAKDAIRKWKFRPFMRDGQPVKATGYVSFNFAL